MPIYHRCKWCGREYDPNESTSSNILRFCSGKCEAEAKRSEMEAERARMEARKLRQESGGGGEDGCSWGVIKWGAIIFIICALIGMCEEDDEKEKQDKKASQSTEQVTKTDKQKVQAVRKLMKQIELTDDETPIKVEILPEEDVSQAAPKETPVTMDEEQKTMAETSLRQVLGDQTSET